MDRIAIVTDTNSGMSQDECVALGVQLIPMPIIVDDTEYFEGVSCTYEHFFEMLNRGSEVSTSQPSPESVTSVWDRVLEDHDFIIHIPMSSALSSSCYTARALALDYDGKVFVIDNKRISISQRTSVLDAIALVKKGLTAAEIAAKLENNALNASIYLAVNRLDLLRKSGRVTASAAALATVLGIKPVLQIQGGKLDAFSKERGMARAQKAMLDALEKDRTTRFAGKHYVIQAAYSGEDAPALQWLEKCREFFGDSTIEMYRLPLSICCHVADGVAAVGIFETEE